MKVFLIMSFELGSHGNLQHYAYKAMSPKDMHPSSGKGAEHQILHLLLLWYVLSRKFTVQH